MKIFKNLFDISKCLLNCTWIIMNSRWFFVAVFLWKWWIFCMRYWNKMIFWCRAEIFSAGKWTLFHLKLTWKWCPILPFSLMSLYLLRSTWAFNSTLLLCLVKFTHKIAFSEPWKSTLLTQFGVKTMKLLEKGLQISLRCFKIRKICF